MKYFIPAVHYHVMVNYSFSNAQNMLSTFSLIWAYAAKSHIFSLQIK
jgi:hypothetical protein